MSNATFYYQSPLALSKDRGFLENLFKDDERSHIENVNNLVSKLAMAKENLSEDSRWRVHCRELNFPFFTFYIESYNSLWAASRELFNVTYPLYPLFIEGDKTGISIVERFLEDEMQGHLEKKLFPLFTKMKKIVLPESYSVARVSPI